MDIIDIYTAGILDGETTQARGKSEEARHRREGDG